MSRRLIFSRSAQRDLNETLVYIAKDKPGAALRFVERLQAKCDLLLSQPLLGEDCSELRPDMRRLRYQKYLIFYRFTDEKVEVVRVIHGARDWHAILQQDD
jgi:toxin ParE1/3/4